MDGDDVVLSMKQGNVAAPSRVVTEPAIAAHFQHHGHRTAISQRALQAHADRLLGYPDIDGVGFVVSELSPYEADLDWFELTEPDEIASVVEAVGRASATAHSVGDSDADVAVVEFRTEDAVSEAVGGREDEFVDRVVDFAQPAAPKAAPTTSWSSRPSAAARCPGGRPPTGADGTPRNDGWRPPRAGRTHSRPTPAELRHSA